MTYVMYHTMRKCVGNLYLNGPELHTPSQLSCASVITQLETSGLPKMASELRTELECVVYLQLVMHVLSIQEGLTKFVMQAMVSVSIMEVSWIEPSESRVVSIKKCGCACL